MIECCSVTVSDDNAEDDDDDIDGDDDEDVDEHGDNDENHLTMLFRDSTTDGVRDNGARTLLKNSINKLLRKIDFLSLNELCISCTYYPDTQMSSYMQIYTKTHLHGGTDILMSCVALLFWHIMTVVLIFCENIFVFRWSALSITL